MVGSGDLTIGFTGLDAYSFIVKTQENRTFSMKIDLEALKPEDAGKIEFDVLLDNGAKSLTSKMVLELVYEPGGDPPPSEVNETESIEGGNPSSPSAQNGKSSAGLNGKTPNVSGFKGVIVPVKPPEPLKSFIEEINSRGVVKISFSEPIDASRVTLDQINKSLKIYLVIPGNEAKSGRRLAENLDFEWDVESFSETEIMVKLNFTNALAISQGDEQDLL